MIASVSRVFMNEQMHWTLEATCSLCARETSAPLLVGVPVECVACGAVIKIDPQKTLFCRREGTGHARQPVSRAFLS